ncbi:MAG: sulfotransferase domain-containing protein [Acidimicrobiia bacterium]|nr:sulfotransferase domain-containing protein [Acidimicrobiia bacterium]
MFVQKVKDSLKLIIPLRARRWLVQTRLAARQWTAGSRLVPDFVIIGCQRGGTSSLYRYLGSHPEIGPSLRKETEYFTVNYPMGERWYRAHFPLALRRRWAKLLGRKLLVFEATPDYLVDPRAPERCHRLLPDAKIVMLLREPAERALSHFHHNIRLGLESETFQFALENEADRIADDLVKLGDPSHQRERFNAFRRYTYVERGRYADQLERWLDHYPSEQVLVLESESFFGDPAAVLEQIEDFVGAKRWLPAEFRNYSYLERGVTGHSKVPPDLLQFLDDRFLDSNQRLREMLDVELEWLSNRD